MEIMEHRFLTPVRSVINDWRMPLLFGSLFIFSGILVFSVSFENYGSLNLLVGVLILVPGIRDSNLAVLNRKQIKGYKWFLTGGLLDLLIGILLIYDHVITIILLSYYVAFWLLFRSIMSIGVSFEQQSTHILGWEWLLIFVIGTLAFAFTILANIVFGSFDLLSMTAFSCIVFGFFRVIMALGPVSYTHLTL